MQKNNNIFSDRTKTTHKIFSCVLLFICLSGCSKVERFLPCAQYHSSFRAVPAVIETPLFKIQSIRQFIGKGDVLRVYIEGDGRVWQGKKPSPDPSPKNPVLLNLMFQDPFSEKVYLARPCQFVNSAHCSPVWWTEKQYSQEVIDSIDSAITTIKRYKPWKKLELIGYSGGATIALLIAAKRSDIISVRTIAGNLSPDLAFHLHKLSLPASTLLPSNYLSKLELLPQIHYVGRHDAVVPQAIAQYYVEQFENKKCIRYAVIPDTTHTKGWDNVWLSLLAQQPQCS